VKTLKALQKGGEPARAEARRLLALPETAELSLPFLLLSSELSTSTRTKASQAILQVLKEEKRADRVALLEYTTKQTGLEIGKELVALLASLGTPEARAALERLSQEHRKPEGRAMAAEALAGLRP
jgi:endonuclease V-like protein UPF0215 family